MQIRDLRPEDIHPLFEMQNNAASRWMAAFGSKDFDNEEAFTLHMAKIAGNKDLIYKVVEHDGQIVGTIGRWFSESGPELTYEVDRKYQGLGFATAAVKDFLIQYSERPLYAHTAADNLASQAILKKFGFSKYEETMAFSEIRNMEILEFGFVLH